MGTQRTGYQPKSTDEQDQHDESVEKTRWLKIDMHVGDDARQDEECAGNREKPTGGVSAVPK